MAGVLVAAFELLAVFAGRLGKLVVAAALLAVADAATGAAAGG